MNVLNISTFIQNQVTLHYFLTHSPLKYLKSISHHILQIKSAEIKPSGMYVLGNVQEAIGI